MRCGRRAQCRTADRRDLVAVPVRQRSRVCGRTSRSDGYYRHPTRNRLLIEAPSMFQARVAVVVRRLAPGALFGDGVRLTAGMMPKIPPERIGRMQYGNAATHLILQLREIRRRAGE